jgi:hypothetical protein
MLGRRRPDDDPPSRLEELCSEEERVLEGWGEGLDPMRTAAAEARLEQACERLDQRRSNPPRSPL